MENEKKENEKKLVFLVDDNPATLQSGKNVLSMNFRVATAPSAVKLFELLQTNTPEIIVLDIDMPELNGYEVIKVLKFRQDTKDIPVIFLTGKTEADDELMGLNLGAVDYITKPFQPMLLLKRVEMHLLVETQKRKLEKQSAELLNYSNNLQKMVWEKIQNVLELQDTLFKTMKELSECRNDITEGQIDRVQERIKTLLEEMEKSKVYCEEKKQ
ncbi:MAG: response regulator [Treponema sp.]|nr:response regulator [Treponema sp.]